MEWSEVKVEQEGESVLPMGITVSRNRSHGGGVVQREVGCLDERYYGSNQAIWSFLSYTIPLFINWFFSISVVYVDLSGVDCVGMVSFSGLTTSSELLTLF
jgi:hypothetical protein